MSRSRINGTGLALCALLLMVRMPAPDARPVPRCSACFFNCLTLLLSALLLQAVVVASANPKPLLLRGSEIERFQHERSLMGKSPPPLTLGAMAARHADTQAADSNQPHGLS